MSLQSVTNEIVLTIWYLNSTFSIIYYDSMQFVNLGATVYEGTSSATEW